MNKIVQKIAKLCVAILIVVFGALSTELFNETFGLPVGRSDAMAIVIHLLELIILFWGTFKIGRWANR